jgi:hypothetical protein
VIVRELRWIMNNKLIEHISKNNTAISLVRVDDSHFEVVYKQGTSWTLSTFSKLVDALKHFNELAGMFE